MCADRSDPRGKMAPLVGQLSRVLSRTVLVVIFTSFVIALMADNFAISSAHLSNVNPNEHSSGGGSSSPYGSNHHDHVADHSRDSGGGSGSSGPSIRSNNHNSAADDQKIHELLSNLYSQMHKYHHSPQHASLTSPETANPNLDNHLIAERVQEYLQDAEYVNKQENLKTHQANSYAGPSFKKTTLGKTLMNTEEVNINKLAGIASAGGGDIPSHYQPIGLAEVPSANPNVGIPNGANGSGGGNGAVGANNGSPVNSKHKHQTYVSGLSSEKQQRSTVEEGRDEPTVQVTNKYLVGQMGQSGSQRKVVQQGATHSTEPKSSPQMSQVGVGSSGASVNGPSGSVHSADESIYELLVSMDSRMQKMQETLLYYRNLPKPPMHSSSAALNPIYTNYLSLIKAQVLNIESTIEAKFSNIEHKFSNIEIEESIWKKTINWKLEEMSSKLSQNENKLSFSNEQIMNKLELFERNFQLVTNDFFAKFLLVNEKLNKIELNLQTKWNDLEAKMRNTFADTYKPPHSNGNGGGGKPQGMTMFGNHQIDLNGQENVFKESVMTPHTSTHDSNKAMPNMQNNPEYSGSQSGSLNGHRKVVEGINSKEPNTNSKLTWNKQVAIKPNNVTNVLADRIKLHSFQRFIKLMNSKTNQTLSGIKNKFNSTYFELMNNNPATVGPNMVNNDAPQMDTLVNTSTSPRPTDRPATVEENTTTTKNQGGGKGDKDKAMAPSIGGENSNGHRLSPIGSERMNKSTAQIGVNNRNLDSLEGVNYADLVNTRNLTKEVTQQQHPPPPNHQVYKNTKQPLTDESLNLAKCEHWFSIMGIKKDKFDEANFVSMCQKLSEISESSATESMVPSMTMAAAGMYRDATGHHPEAHHQHNRSDNRESILEKRHLSEEVIVDQHKDLLLNADKFAVPMEEMNQLNQLNNDMKTGTKLEELDSKLQFFSSKIIKIVQEMWLSSQASENYLKETLSVTNKTNMLLTEEFAKLKASMKPVTQLSTLAEDIREPILNRLQEMSTAFNNSVEVILNTQAEFITSCRALQEETKIFDVLDFIMNEIRNKTLLTTNSLVHLNRNFQEQGGQFNRSLDFLLYKLDVVSKKTIEGVRGETIKLLDIMKGEINHQITSAAMSHSSNNHGQSFLATQDIPKSMGNSPTGNANHAGQPSLPACHNECFITKEEFANICINIDGSKLFQMEPEPVKSPAISSPTSPSLQHHHNQSNVHQQESQQPQDKQTQTHPPLSLKGGQTEEGVGQTDSVAEPNLTEQFQHHNTTRTLETDQTQNGGQIEINNGNSEN